MWSLHFEEMTSLGQSEGQCIITFKNHGRDFPYHNTLRKVLSLSYFSLIYGTEWMLMVYLFPHLQAHYFFYLLPWFWASKDFHLRQAKTFADNLLLIQIINDNMYFDSLWIVILYMYLHMILS